MNEEIPSEHFQISWNHSADKFMIDEFQFLIVQYSSTLTHSGLPTLSPNDLSLAFSSTSKKVFLSPKYAILMVVHDWLPLSM